MLQESLPLNWLELAAAAVEWANKPFEIGDVLYVKMRGSIAKMALVTALRSLLAIQPVPVPVVAKVELEPMARRKPPQREEVASVARRTPPELTQLQAEMRARNLGTTLPPMTKPAKKKLPVTKEAGGKRVHA